MAIIYKLEAGGKLYVGSTNDLMRRKREHRARAFSLETKQCLHNKLYKAIREAGEFSIDELDICEDKHATKIEQYWITYLKPELNSNWAIGMDPIKHSKRYNKYKNIIRRCEVCEKNIGYYNWSYHVHSPKHLKCVEIKNNI